MKQSLVTIVCAIVATVVCCSDSFGQKPKLPDAGYVYPPAVVIGQANSVTLGGFDWTDDLQWFIDSPDVSLADQSLPGEYVMTPPPYWVGTRAGTAALPIPREVTGRIEVKSDAAPGIVRWQTANANGAGKVAQFVLTTTPDVLEKRLPRRPQTIPSPPVAVSGRLSRLTEVDVYEFVAEADALVTVDLMARQLGSDFNGVIEVHDADGVLLNDLADTLGQDGSVSFATRKGARYSVSIRDVDFRGDRSYIYRLLFTRGPRIKAAFPARVQRGVTQAVTFTGVTGQQGEVVPFEVVADVSVPVDAEQKVISQQIETPGGIIRVPVPVSSVAESVRTVSSSEQAMPLSVPAAVTGRWNPTERTHRYQWEAAEQSWWSLQLQSRAIGSKLDVAVAVLDTEGNILATADDVGSLTDPSLSFLAKKAGRYTVEVKAIDPPTGQTTDQYRLSLQPEAPDFRLTVPQVINIPREGKTAIDLQVQRYGGFAGAVAMKCSNLPAGLAFEGDAVIPEGKDKVKVTLVAGPDAKVQATAVQFSGTATINESEQTHNATASAATNLAPRVSRDVTTSTTLVAVTMPAPFRVLVVDRERQRDVPRGTTYLADLVIERDDGFDGDLYIAMSAKQSRDRQGIRGPLLKVPKGAPQVQYPCFMPEWLATDLTRRIVVHGVGAVTDPDGEIRWLTNAGDARITMIMEGALLKVDLPEPQVRIGIRRSGGYPGSGVSIK